MRYTLTWLREARNAFCVRREDSEVAHIQAPYCKLVKSAPGLQSTLDRPCGSPGSPGA